VIPQWSNQHLRTEKRSGDSTICWRLPVEKRLLSLGKANILISELEQTGSSDESPSPAGTSDSSLLRKFQEGQPDASTELYLRYAERLHALVAAQSSKVLARRVDAEEIVQSVFRTFFRRAAQGHYSVPAGEEIWKLLLVIALNKVRATGAYHCAAKRDMRQTVGGAVFEHAMESEQCRDEGALTVLRMVIEDLLEGMTAANRRTIELRIEGYEVAEITERVQRSKRTVERVLQGFRNRLEALIQEDLPE
jgi:RNA polymerase sigma-70 factor (ECF subfamily)